MPIGGPVQGVDRSPLDSKKDDGGCFFHKILSAKGGTIRLSSSLSTLHKQHSCDFCDEKWFHFLSDATRADRLTLLFLSDVLEKVERIVAGVGGFLFAEQILLAGLGGSDLATVLIMKCRLYITEEIRLLGDGRAQGSPIFVLDNRLGFPKEIRFLSGRSS